MAMFSALTEVLQTTFTSMGNQLDENPKCQMQQVSKLTEAFNQITSLQNANKLATRSTDDPESFDNSDSGENDEVNDGGNTVTIHETDCSPYNETDLVLPFCLIRRPHHLQWQQQLSQKMISWQVQSSKNSLNLPISPYHKPVTAVCSKRRRSSRSGLLKMEDLPEKEDKDLQTLKNK